ncbi:MAG: MBL fold metallo-hydrolase [Alphaproteobacteria bacterium]|nr:MBL fold metallo-hydrolase [Alphaproteobacteria bacterium]
MPDRARLSAGPLTEPLAAMAKAGAGTGIELAWLGQAGFLLRARTLALAIDPYLSNSLTRKYAGTATPHERIMPAPVPPEALCGLDFVFSTHRHTDHMDPETLVPLLAANDRAVLIAPQAAAGRIGEIGIAENRIRLVNAGDAFELADGIRLQVLASAHEGLDRNDDGDYPFLGYGLTLDGLTIYHSGDCVPYDGLGDAVAALDADLALLPINGRRPELAARGIPGNFTPREAAALCVSAGIPNLIAHHFGMFAFNSADPDAALAEIRKQAPALNALAASLATLYRLAPEH